MSTGKMRILDMLSKGQVTAEEAALLLEQVEDTPAAAHAPAQHLVPGGRMLRVRVFLQENDSDNPTNVSLNLPLKVAGILGKLLPSMMPSRAREAMGNNGVDFSSIDWEGLIDALAETGGDIINVNQEDEDDKIIVRIYVE